MPKLMRRLVWLVVACGHPVEAEPPTLEDTWIEVEGPGGTFRVDSARWEGTVETLLGPRVVEGPTSGEIGRNFEAHLLLTSQSLAEAAPTICGDKQHFVRVGVRKRPAPLVVLTLSDGEGERRRGCPGLAHRLRDALWADLRAASLALLEADPLPPPLASCRPDDTFAFRFGQLTLDAQGHVEGLQGAGDMPREALEKVKCAFQRVDLGNTVAIPGDSRRAYCQGASRESWFDIDVTVEGFEYELRIHSCFNDPVRDLARRTQDLTLRVIDPSWRNRPHRSTSPQ